ncbi:MAG: hypothetical protein ACYSUV_02075 [Planctomycetota bacterium]|jgi:hypothetical protein
MLTADITNYDQRVRTGRVKEIAIIETLRRAGVTVEPPTREEDMRQGIDAWIIGPEAHHSLQIKFRESGDDIIFEIIKDIAQNILGRDFQGVAEYYLVVNRAGVGRMVKTKDIKTRAESLLKMAQEEWARKTGVRRWEGKGWELKVTVDRAHGYAKLMAYFNPNLFEAVGTWQFSF